MSIRYAILLGAGALLNAHSAGAQILFADGARPEGNTAAGVATYVRTCITCHGPRFEGSPFAPTLTGPAFLNRWRGKPAAELLTVMQKTMPPKGMGTVKPEAFPDLLALLVRANTEGQEFIASLGMVPASSAGATATGSSSDQSGQKTRSVPPSPKDALKLASMSPVTDALLSAPPAADWLMWRRTPDAAGFSPLNQITRSNVRQLKQAWSLKLEPSANEITPVVHEGVLYIHSGNVILAVDGATGRILWRHERVATRPDFAALRQNSGGQRPAVDPRQFEGGQRARMKPIALYGHGVYFSTTDGHVVALDTRTGSVLWDRAVSSGTNSFGMQLGSGPLVARGVVMVGASLGLTNKGGNFIVALDAATGVERWRFNTVARPGTPGGDSWNGAPVEERFGGGVWTTGSYDAGLNLVYFGIGNTYTTATLLEPRAGSAGVTRNDGLYTDATVALRPETGELVWHHQHHKRDVWDQDWAFEQTLVTLGKGTAARRAVVTSGKTAVFEAVDAATGEFLFAQNTGLSNLFIAIDPLTGEKHTNPALEPVPGKTLLLCPSNLGARNWPATSLNTDTGMLFAPLQESCTNFTYQPRSPAEFANGGSDISFSPQRRPDSDDKIGRIMAIDLGSRSVKWTHRQRMPLTSSLLATAGGLVFMSDAERYLNAFDQDDGSLLWRKRLPAAAESTLITYSVGGRQYIAAVSGEGSHLGQYNRRLVPELPAPQTQLSLVVFSL